MKRILAFLSGIAVAGRSVVGGISSAARNAGLTTLSPALDHGGRLPKYLQAGAQRPLETQMLSLRSSTACCPASVAKLSAALLLASATLILFSISSPAQDLHPDFLSYMNAPATDVTGRYGPPASTQHKANGDTILTYEWPRAETIGGYTVSNAEPMYPTGLPGGLPYSGSPMGAARRYIPVQTVDAPCEVRFTVGKDGQVRDVGWAGEGCVIE